MGQVRATTHGPHMFYKAFMAQYQQLVTYDSMKAFL